MGGNDFNMLYLMINKIKTIEYKIEAHDILIQAGELLVHKDKYLPKLIFEKIKEIALGYGLTENYIITIKPF
jgi:hypothetical protein